MKEEIIILKGKRYFRRMKISGNAKLKNVKTEGRDNVAGEMIKCRGELWMN